ncbi:unnamed protein product [Lactuca saligna]|uniref:Uncharacterized protein n=1 Tax=Lactuca saligna TaxID=75948 RepID=A0AA35ZKX4_LACSI|nr:unnamed protein product [Lactuca saligna]
MDYTDYDLIFGISDHAVDVEVHAPDKHIPEFAKLTDESTSTSQQSKNMQNSPVEGEKLDSSTLNNEEHSFKEEKDQMNVEVEGEHVVEGEHNVDDACSNAGSENDEIYKDAPLEFDLAYPPMEKWTRDHPKDQEEKKSKKSKKVAPTSPKQKTKGSKSSKSPKKQTENVEVTVDETHVIEPIMEETQENVIIPSKTRMFRRIKMKSTHKRKSSSQTMVRKTQITHQGVLIRELLVPVSPGSKKRVAEDIAKHLSQPKKKKKTKKTRKLVLSTVSREEDERIPETPEFTPINTSSILEKTVIIPPEVSIVESIFEEVRTSYIPTHVSDMDANVNMGKGGSKDADQGPIIYPVTPTSTIPLTSTTVLPTFEHIISQPFTSIFPSQSTDTPKPSSPTETDNEGFGGTFKNLEFHEDEEEFLITC